MLNGTTHGARAGEAAGTPRVQCRALPTGKRKHGPETVDGRNSASAAGTLLNGTTHGAHAREALRAPHAMLACLCGVSLH